MARKNGTVTKVGKKDFYVFLDGDDRPKRGYYERALSNDVQKKDITKGVRVSCLWGAQNFVRKVKLIDIK